MELIVTDDYFVFQSLHKTSTSSLWLSRETGGYEIRESWDLAGQNNPECFGIFHGLVGKIRFHPDLPERLVLIRNCDKLGSIPGKDFGGKSRSDAKTITTHDIFRVQNVVAIPVIKGILPPVSLKPCPKHQVNKGIDGGGDGSEPSKLKKLGAPLKLLSADSIKSAGSAASALASQVVKFNPPSTTTASSTAATSTTTTSTPIPPPPPPPNKALERLEKRILEEFLKLFNDNDSFYFSQTGDLTNSLQRQQERSEENVGKIIYDDRFFFNKIMLSDLIALQDPRIDQWILPLIQGYVEFQRCSQEYTDPELQFLPSYYEIIIISRRSRHRAGTRYKRRGVDADGNVANYVETEQILLYHHYALSFVMIRGSIPVYWSQPGLRYRPPPVMDKTPEDDLEAFKKHFQEQFSIYGIPIQAINLAEKTGREKVITDAFFETAVSFNDERLRFITFDFHEYCKGMHFENIDVLIAALAEDIRSMRYCWFDSHGMVCSQKGVFRVNCVDCLDRTNVVQTAIARAVLEIQLTKLGLVAPEQNLDESMRLAFQGLWANNGDVISRQYAGTNALKGDFTRTGERNLSGLMKDGMNSANRYYLNQFRDSFRQGVIDIMTGQTALDGEELSIEDGTDGGSDRPPEEDQVKNVIEDCKKLLIRDPDDVVGAWGLIDNDPVSGDPRQDDMDTILILTRDSYYVAVYDDDSDKVTNYQRVFLKDVEKVEFGVPEKDAFNLTNFRNKHKDEYSIRIHYKMRNSEELESGYFHMFRSTNLRFFNNVAVTITTEDEKMESLKSIADTIGLTIEMYGGIIPDMFFGRLDKRKSKIASTPDSRSTLRTVGSKALISVSNQIAKLNPMKLRNSAKSESAAESKQQQDRKSPDFFSLHSKIGESFLQDLPTVNFSLLQDQDSSLFPPLTQQHFSKSSDDIQRIRVVEPKKETSTGEPPIRSSSHKNLSFVSEVETAVEILEEVAPAVLSPFAKITKGIQNIGASLSNRSDKKSFQYGEDEGGGVSSIENAMEFESADYMKYRLNEVKSNTRFLLL